MSTRGRGGTTRGSGGAAVPTGGTGWADRAAPGARADLQRIAQVMSTRGIRVLGAFEGRAAPCDFGDVAEGRKRAGDRGRGPGAATAASLLRTGGGGAPLPSTCRSRGRGELFPWYHLPLPPRRSWLDSWRAYVHQTGRKGASSLAVASAAAAVQAATGNGTTPVAAAAAAGPRRPGPLAPAMRGLFCPCHPQEPRLRMLPPSLCFKRNK